MSLARTVRGILLFLTETKAERFDTFETLEFNCFHTSVAHSLVSRLLKHTGPNVREGVETFFRELTFKKISSRKEYNDHFTTYTIFQIMVLITK